MFDTDAERAPSNIAGFPREANRACCFEHIVNLCAKSLLRPFEVDKKSGFALSSAEKALQELADDLELDELATGVMEEMDVQNVDDEPDNLEGWVDESRERI